jgi:hypothetical protein
LPNIIYEFRFQTSIQNPNTFLYNTGPITALDSPNWNVRQTFSVTKRRTFSHPGNQAASSAILGTNLSTPPCRIGPRSTPNYDTLAAAAIHNLSNGETVFAGQRAEGFFVDLGSIFDLGTLRPFENLHLIPTPAAPGVDGLKGFNVHTIALQIPKTHLTRDGQDHTDPTDPKAVIGVWATASRRKVSVRTGTQPSATGTGPWIQVSRLGNPLFNEVIVPIGQKDYWNAVDPEDDQQFAEYVQHPELAGLLPVLYPGVFPHLAALSAARADLVAILLTGLPAGLIPGFQNYTGATQADMLRLNIAVPPASTPNPLGILGGDLAGFPNGRRISDDVVTIEIRAVAGATYPLVDASFVPDGAVGVVTDGVAAPSAPLLTSFPYLGTPYEGYNHKHDP